MAHPQHHPNDVVKSFFPMNYGGMKSSPSGYDRTNLNSYNHEVVNAIRSSNVAYLRELLYSTNSTSEQQTFEACNHNSEYLIHLACRRANLETIQFLVLEAGVNVHVRDGLGRTVLHDACWRPRYEPAILEFLMQVLDPMFLLMTDDRGHSAFDYIRKENWNQLTGFLETQRDLVRQRIRSSRLWERYCQAAARHAATN
eukprot:CAMPEP_0172451030 /NCGR_PEP_ID=MMETSP1065-20121228/9198_1 /TAXON_ID=265537 /ORGANISM="Amphiprora paludosa, Strain CCMP125" /LENGTH=198 /DNA_ID=CAMNT_0013202917 /DNA_START=283 /DNA_END=879 /DNA_ORIENTATION=+